MDFRKLLTDLGMNPIALLAGLVGSIVVITMNEKETSFRSAGAQLMCGVAFAGYGTEFFAGWLKWEPRPSTLGLMGLCLGISGLFIARGIIKIAKRFQDKPEGFIPKIGKDGTTTDNDRKLDS